jgi:uncharacterized protein
MRSVLIAFSGGVDSTFLLKMAHDILGNKVLAITAQSETYPESELKEARRMAKLIGAKHKILQTKELKKKNFYRNPPNRCYFCKKELFSELKKIAKKRKIKYILDASNFDDLKDYRPGRTAAKELGVRSPLAEVGLTKQEIRLVSKKLKLPTWSKPAQACLASRIPYGEKITEPKLKGIAGAEAFLKKMGMTNLRVRNHQQIARIETAPGDLPLILKNSKKIIREFKKLGFHYITLDLEGYRTGSLNEVLKNDHSRN